MTCIIHYHPHYHPHDCRDLITLIRTAYGMEHVTVRYLVAGELEEDAEFRRRFDI